MKKKIKIICTLGPSSFNKNILHKLSEEKIDLYRINLSHTNISDVSKRINYLKKNNIQNICIDTEGAQIRTTETNRKFIVKKNSILKVFNQKGLSSSKKIFLYPEFDFLKLGKDTIIKIGFDSLIIKVVEINKSGKYLTCKVEKTGILDSKKGVHIESNIKLPSLTKKDIYSLKLARKLKIKFFAISFVNSENDLKLVKKIIGKNTFIISKIETKNAVLNLEKILKESNAVLIDRGDLSRYIPIEKIPFAQERIIKKSNKKKVPVYVATNLLETMIKESQPTRAESHDIYSTLIQGSSGLVLAAETAIGKNPIACVKFLKRCITNYFKTKKNTLSNKKKINYLFNNIN